jgi:hypothetical protein
MFYTIPNRTSPGDVLHTSDETTYAHDCSANRVTTPYKTLTFNVMAIGALSMQNLFHNAMGAKIAGYHYDAVFEDGAGVLSTGGPYNPGLPCNYSDSAWLSAGQALDLAAPAPVIDNALAVTSAGVTPNLPLMDGSNTIGGNMEGCYNDSTHLAYNGWLWQAAENTELQTAAKHKLFFCMGRNQTSASSAIAARLYTLASFLLTYDPATSVLWDEFPTTSGLHVMPESQFIALNPVVATPASISSLLTSTMVYGREYKDCYVAGNFVGPCAIAVNSDQSSTYVFPYPQYQHTLVIAGGGILDGGTISTAGGPPPSNIPPLSAEIVFP